MNSSQRILVVDDDANIREIVAFALRTAGFETAEAENGAQAMELHREWAPDLLILDIVMPGLDGIEVCKQIRNNSYTPIVFLSSKDEEVDRVVGLELGGDDYVTKPFSPRELVARAKAVLRRSAKGRQPVAEACRATTVIRHGLLSLDCDLFRTWWGKHEITLTVTEFNIVRAFLGHPGKVFTRDQLMDRAYQDGWVVTDRTIDSHVRRVRKKFAEAGGDPIETVHGLGYRLGPCDRG